MMSGRKARIGIDLGGTKIEGIRLEADGGISRRIRLDTPRNDYPATVAAIVDLAGRLDEGDARIGVGAPGCWLAAPGRMQNCNSTWLNAQPLLDDLNRALHGRVRIANDADCFTLSEARSGSAQGHDVVFGVILGTGVGGGVVVGGRLLTGPNGLAGEWGHTPLSQAVPAAGTAAFPSRRCYCGRLNCVETFLSGPGLLASHQALWPDESEAPGSAEEVYRRARLPAADPGWWQMTPADAASGDAAARAQATLAQYCQMLAENLARIVNTLDPHAIVFGGGLSQMQEVYPVLRRRMMPHVFGEVFETALLPPAFGATSGVRGAAWLWDPEEGDQ